MAINNFNKVDVTADFNPFEKIGKNWTLVTATDGENYNTMTASWGFAGYLEQTLRYRSYSSAKIHQRVFGQGRIFYP